MLGNHLLADQSFPEFTEVFQQQNVIMLLIEPETGQIVQANPAAAVFYGYPQEQLQQMTIQQINTFNAEQVAEERHLAETQGRNYFIFRHALASGEQRRVQVHSQPYWFGDQRLLLSIIQDITPNRHEEQELWQYQVLLEEKVDAQVEEIAQRKRWQTYSLLLAIAAQSLVIMLLIINIQGRKRLEAEKASLLASLQDKNNELTRLSEVMAHHFQEPARRLMSFAQRLQTQTDLVNNDKARLSLEFIDTQAKRLSDLVKDVQRYLSLDHLGVDFGKLADTQSCLQAAIQSVELNPDEVNLEIQQPLPQVDFSAKKLQLLFSVLLSNAWRYQLPDQVLRIQIRAEQSGERVYFRIADNGRGIAPEYRDQVFGLFSRLVPNSTPGTGMGLALAQKLVKQAGGEIWIEDGLDTGTCLVFDLPARAATTSHNNR
ncbi:ATP-binding protein [Marinospirillum sp.]|uniref:sensor histidine kinase n=1 Tax=Marinospirillum sp. TaxID=2183934 RepID=UPI00384C0BF4